MQDLLKRFQEGTEWELSKVKCATDAKPEYVYAPVKQVVDVGLSTFKACSGVKQRQYLKMARCMDRCAHHCGRLSGAQLGI